MTQASIDLVERNDKTTLKLKQYKLFLDDSGTKEYSPVYSTNRGSTPYFLFGGVLLTAIEAGILSQKVKEIKKHYFGSCELEIKANWLRREIERKKRYLEPFSLSEEKLTAFTDDIYDLIVKTECSLLACIIFKEQVQALYEKPHYAPAIAYDCILQRAQQAMEAEKGRVHVTIDDMSGATVKKNQYKDNLRHQHQRLLTSGSVLQKGMKFDRIDGLSFSDSKADERLQLADLVAYSVYKQFLDYPHEWEMGNSDLPLYKYFKKLGSKFRKAPNGRIQGFGIVKFPLKNRILWGIKEKKLP